MDEMIQAVLALRQRVAELERRMENMMRVGTVSHVDPEKQQARIKIGEADGRDILSPWRPYSQWAGALKVHSPPSVGQQMVSFSPSGDLRQGMLAPFTFSNANQSPSTKSDENKITFGNMSISLQGDKLVIGGKVVCLGELHVGGEGGQPVHRKGDADSDGDTAVGHATKLFAN